MDSTSTNANNNLNNNLDEYWFYGGTDQNVTIDDMIIDATIEATNRKRTLSNCSVDRNDSTKKLNFKHNANDNVQKNLMKESDNNLNHPISNQSSINDHVKVSKVKIQPVIFFKLGENLDKLSIDRYLLEKVKDVVIEESKLTANNNLLLYTKSNEDNEKLTYNNELFESKSKLNLNAIDK
jgi:hypothetical protein